jgi:hypothetical protein
MTTNEQAETDSAEDSKDTQSQTELGKDVEKLDEEDEAKSGEDEVPQ